MSNEFTTDGGLYGDPPFVAESGSALSQEEWLKRWVAHWRSRGCVDDEYARLSAESWLESNPDDATEKPEEIADDIFEEEMEQARQSM